MAECGSHHLLSPLLTDLFLSPPTLPVSWHQRPQVRVYDLNRMATKPFLYHRARVKALAAVDSGEHMAAAPGAWAWAWGGPGGWGAGCLAGGR